MFFYNIGTIDNVNSALAFLASLQTFLCYNLSFHKMLWALYLYLFLPCDFCFFIIEAILSYFLLKIPNRVLKFPSSSYRKSFSGIYESSGRYSFTAVLQHEFIVPCLFVQLSLSYTQNLRLPTNNVYECIWILFTLLSLNFPLLQMANWKKKNETLDFKMKLLCLKYSYWRQVFQTYLALFPLALCFSK